MTWEQFIQLYMKTVPWNEFIEVITSGDIIYRYTYVNTGGSGIEDKGKVVEIDGVNRTLWLHYNCIINQKYNQNVEIKDGHYVIYKKVWDEEDTGREEEVEGNNGFYYKQPIMKRLDTYQLIPIRVEIFKKVQL